MHLKIIYIDDEPDLCEMFVENFSSKLVLVKAYSDPEEGLKAIYETQPDIVFLDYRLVNITGDEIAAKISKDIPKVIITGDLNIHTKENFIKIFQKPYCFEEIDTLLEEFIERRQD